MATISLKYGTYTHPLAPQLKIESRMLSDDSGATIGYAEIWQIDGTLVGSTQSDLASKITQLEVAYGIEGEDLVLLASDGSTVLRQLDSSTSIAGTQLESLTYPGGGAPELATSRNYSLTVSAGFLTAVPDIHEDHQTTHYQVGSNGKSTRTVSGSLKTIQGVAASSKYAGRDPGTPSGYARVREERRINGPDNELVYEFVDQEVLRPFPSGVLEGAASRTETLGADDRRTVIHSGSFSGSGATAAALTQKAIGLAIVSESTTSNEYTGEVAFRYEYEVASGDSLLALSEQIELASAYEKQVTRFTVGGRPVLQTVGWEPARLVQSGHAVGRGSYPPFPPMAFASSFLAASPIKRRVSPQDAGAVKTDWRIEWRYEFLFESSPYFPAPETK